MLSNVIMVKSLDWSTFVYGFNIPVEMQPALYALIGRKLEIGEKMPIKVLIDGQLFDARLSNSGFDRQRFEDHTTEIVRILYGKRLASKIQQLFPALFNYLAPLKASLPPRAQLKVPEKMKQEFLLSFTSAQGVFEIEPLERAAVTPKLVSEEIFESTDVSWVDHTASIEEKNRLVKIRRIDRSIGDNLKRLYDYRCQISGEKIGDKYGGSVVEAHHIDYFVNSQNNDSSNIIIVSPNFHRIIHSAKPRFNYETLQFEFANGVIEHLTLNKHLTAPRTKA